MREFLILGMMSTTASLGLILLWDVDAGLTQIDKYLYSTEDYIKVKSYVISMLRKYKKKKKKIALTVYTCTSVIYVIY